MVPVVAVDPGQAALSDLLQLGEAEPAGVVVEVVVVEPVSLLEPLELVSNEAAEGWPHHCS